MINPFFESARAMAHYKYAGLDKYEFYNGKGLVCFLDDTKTNNHVATTRNVLSAILPEATIYSGSIGFVTKVNAVTDCTITCTETGETLPFDEFITKYKVKLINNSKEGNYKGVTLPKSEFMAKKIMEHNLIFTAAAGNVKGVPATSDFVGSAIIVSQAGIDDGKVFSGTHCTRPDFVMFSGYMSGTSFCAPFLLGIIGKMLCVYGDMTQGHAYMVLKNIAKDFGDSGKDSVYGYGLPVLPKIPFVLKDVIKANKAVTLCEK